MIAVTIVEKIDHEAIAEDMLAKAANLICDDPELMPILAEAQGHATLALVDQQARTADALELANKIAWKLAGNGGPEMRMAIERAVNP